MTRRFHISHRLFKKLQEQLKKRREMSVKTTENLFRTQRTQREMSYKTKKVENNAMRNV